MNSFPYKDDQMEQADPLFMGRQQELALFHEVLGMTIGANLVNVYGTGGIGKSSLLHAFQRCCKQIGVREFLIEGHSSMQTPAAFCAQVLQLLGTSPEASVNSEDDIVNACIRQLNAVNETEQVVLLLDAYEYMESIDNWLREHFLVRLGKRLITVIAGRLPLSEAWYLSPEWRKRLLSLPLSELNFTEARQFCHVNGIHSESSIIQLWNETKGHPLMMAVAVIAMQHAAKDAIEEGALRAKNIDFLSYIVERWLREVPVQSDRTIVEAASTLRYFNQDSLSYVLGRELDTRGFRELIRYSFVYKTHHGWRVHDLLRSVVIQDLSSRSPKQYEHYLIRIVSYYYEQFTSRRRTNETTWFAGELMYYIGGPIPRAFLQGLGTMPRYFQPAAPSDFEAIRHYLQRREEEARDTEIQLYDPYSNRSFQYRQSAGQSRHSIMWVNLNELCEIGLDCFWILKDVNETIVGLAVIIPINRKSLDYLLQHPLSSAYFHGLEKCRLDAYAVPESTRSGWFIHTIDIADFENAQLHFSLAHLIISLVFSGEQIIVSPPPTSYYSDALESMLFEKTAHGAHTGYDGKTPSPTYILDTRGDKLLNYLEHMMKLAGIELITRKQPDVEKHEPKPMGNPEVILTERERQVAELLREGLTNAQIANRLHLSEITIKKHLNAMFQKLEVTNRTLLLSKLIELIWK
ncbi:LuxR C-terminal-related transcriptional regulator [Paenibacillus abyssi]|uniref:HTH luxR-type domain-containing protein n=1 Tax=Paenibacillus abyssi TaxID=1340531 RepID=A0A917G0X2_9BACL|nr:LuxR C-terminal-related transcriptional regulator [Paenibacillus abyssi]GGG16934.1 hypothetical protein GCM10010916_37220 [Paenibacillus abyssi]